MPVELKSRLPEIALELGPLTSEGLNEGAKLIVEAAKQRVPVESGRLRDAIHIEDEGQGIAVVAGNNEAFYGHMVEHGTTHSPPHPFLVPAFEETKVEVAAAVEASMRKL